VLDRVAIWSVALTAAAFLTALLLGGTRVLTTAGVGLVLASLALLGFRALAGSFVTDEIARRGAAEDAAQAAWSVGTSLLEEIAIGLALAGGAATVGGLLARPRAV
jgi:hypothetical protein